MNEKKKDKQYRFFNIYFIALLAIYISFNVCLFFSIDMSGYLLAFLGIGIFFLIILRNSIDEKFHELGEIAGNGILSVTSFSLLIACFCILRKYCFQVDQWNEIFWSLLALYVSIPLEQTISALQRLKQNMEK